MLKNYVTGKLLGFIDFLRIIFLFISEFYLIISFSSITGRYFAITLYFVNLQKPIGAAYPFSDIKRLIFAMLLYI